ncbi:hypothetical protein MAR_003528 [Mya arenaria]|uniref:Uncharacterized protein n=1 Tax=Mya arenaria TaxID=6604 RepID=A0ABY7G6A6_MYAAR|nr:hypothetical protein MAR_003528 [Mya arenaria]
MGRTILIATLLLSLCFSGVVMQKEHPFLNKDPLAVGATPANGPDNSLNADGKCFFSDKDTVSPVSVRLVINENDLGLVMLDNDGTAIGDVSWSCFLIDYSEFKDNKDYIEPSDGAQTCKGTGNKKNYFIRQGPVTMDTGVNEVQYRTHIIEVDGIVNTDGTGKPCGGEIDGDDIFYVAKCRRDIDFTQLGDIKVIFKMDKTKCAVKTQDTDGTVINVLNAAYVTSKTLKTDSSHKIVSPVNIAELGEPLYFEGDRDTCPRVTRRKRSVDGSFFDANLPSTVSVNYTVKALGSKSDETLTTAKAGCFDKSIFISLVSVLSLTLLVLVVSAIYLGIRLRMRSNHDEMTSSGTLSGPRTISSKASSLYSNK